MCGLETLELAAPHAVSSNSKSVWSEAMRDRQGYAVAELARLAALHVVYAKLGSYNLISSFLSKQVICHSMTR